ncbi:hypothetical protein MMJ51_07630, partial [Enterococcus cecorum]|nr:hypothetical protein [Enterococcus cecorum]
MTESNRVSGPTPYYGANGIQDYVEGYTHDGEYILIAEDGANDTNNYPIFRVHGKIWVNNHAHVLQTIDAVSYTILTLPTTERGLNSEYWPYLMNTESGR